MYNTIQWNVLDMKIKQNICASVTKKIYSHHSIDFHVKYNVTNS